MAVDNSLASVRSLNPQSPCSPGGSPYVYPTSDDSPVVAFTKRPRLAGKTVVFPENPESCKRSEERATCKQVAKSVLKKSPPSPSFDGPLQELTEEEKKAHGAERVTTLFQQKFKRSLEDSQNEESIKECAFTLMNAKRYFDTALHLVDGQEKSHRESQEVIDKILRSYLFMQASSTARGKLPDTIKQVEFRLKHSNIEEIVEYLVSTKKQYKIDALALLEVAGKTVASFTELKTKIIPSYQEAFKNDAMKLKELVLELNVQAENQELHSKAVACMIRIYQKGVTPDPIDQLGLVLKEAKLKTSRVIFLKKLLLSQFLTSVEGFRYLSQELAVLLRNEIIDKASKIAEKHIVVEEKLEMLLKSYEEYGVDIISLLNSAWQEAIIQREKNPQGISIGQVIVQSVKGKRLLQILASDPTNSHALSSMTSCLVTMDQYDKDSHSFLTQILSTVQNAAVREQLNKAIVFQQRSFLSAAEHLMHLFVKELIDKVETDFERMTIEATIEYFATELRRFEQMNVRVIHLIEFSWHEAKKQRPKMTIDYSFGDTIIRGLKALKFLG